MDKIVEMTQLRGGIPVIAVITETDIESAVWDKTPWCKGMNDTPFLPRDLCDPVHPSAVQHIHDANRGAHRNPSIHWQPHKLCDTMDTITPIHLHGDLALF